MATSTNQIDFTLNADTSSFETNINNSSKAVENLSNNNDTLSESLEDVSKFMKEAAKVNTDLTKAIKGLAKVFDDSIVSTNKEADALDDISKEAKDAAKEIKKVSDAAKDIEKNSKAGNLALEAIKDNLGAIPVVGPTATRALDGLEGSFSKLVLAGAGVGAVAGAVAGLGLAIYGAYTQSEKFRESIESFKENAAVAFTPILNTLGNIGDAIGNVIDGLNKWIKTNNNINGATAKAVQKLGEESLNNIKNISVSAQDQLKLLEDLGYTQKEIAEEGAKIWADAYAQIEEDSKPAFKALKDGYADLVIAQSDILQQITKLEEEQKKYGGVDVYTDPTGHTINFKEKLDELYASLKETNAAMIENRNQRDELMSISKKAREEQDKLNASTQKTTQVKKEEISELEKLKNAYNGFTNTYKAQVELQGVLGDTQNEEKKNLENYIASLQAKVNLVGNFYTEAVKAGKGYLDEQTTIQLQELTGNKSIKGSAEEILNLYKEINDELEKQKKKYEEMNKPLVDIKSVVSQILGSIQYAYSSISSSILQIASADLIDTSKFDEQIEYIQNKLDEFDEAQKEKEEEKQELSDEEYEAYLARLDEEYQKAVEANDLMSQEAIRIKKEELQKKKEEEKKELEEEKKVNKEREELERQLAEAQYNKDYAEWQNQVKLAELQKNKAIADAVVIPALATAQAALGLASSFAQGGITGFAAGVALSATAIGTAVGAAAGVASAASALDNVKSNPPEMPRFEFGTTGYTLGYEEMALVGERGPELIKNMGGILQVQSAAQTEAVTSGLNEKGAMYIENLIFQITQRLTADEIYDYMNSFKVRNIRFRR